MTAHLIMMLCAGMVSSMNTNPDPEDEPELPQEEVEGIIEAGGPDLKYPSAAAAVEALTRRRNYERERLCAMLEILDTPESELDAVQQEIRELEDRIRQHKVQADSLN